MLPSGLMALRDRVAWLTFPVLMGGFVATASWGLRRGYDPAFFGATLAVANFFVLLGLEQVLPRNPRMNLLRDRQSLNDMGHGLLLAILARPLGGAFAVFCMTAAAELRVVGLAAAWPAALPFAAQVGVALVVWTFSDYWIHRSLHTFDRLWWFHALHHDTPEMHVLKSGRLHLGEELFNAALKPIPLLLLGAPAEIMAFVGLWIVFDGNLVHSNIDQRFPSWAHYFLPTVQLHNLHHARDRRYQDSNYSGSSAFWDVLFGTFSHPDRCELGALGIDESPVPPGLLAQLAFPFRAQLRTPPASARSEPLAAGGR
jgi:sterol desaturase/sphingolipid hydroxylase (fatty acid hydroxylase superfamily)